MPRKFFRNCPLHPATAGVRHARARSVSLLRHANIRAFNRHSAAGGVAIEPSAGLVPRPPRMLRAARAMSRTADLFALAALDRTAVEHDRGLLSGPRNAAASCPYEADRSSLAGTLRAHAHRTLSAGRPLVLGVPPLTVAVRGELAPPVG